MHIWHCRHHALLPLVWSITKLMGNSWRHKANSLRLDANKRSGWRGDEEKKKKSYRKWANSIYLAKLEGFKRGTQKELCFRKGTLSLTKSQNWLIK